MIYFLIFLAVLAAIWVLVELRPHPVRGYDYPQLILSTYCLCVLLVTFVILYARHGNNLF
jgi:hypothetical protein